MCCASRAMPLGSWDIQAHEGDILTPPKAKKLPPALIGPVRSGKVIHCRGLPGEAGIYRLTCTAINRHYIGSTFNLAQRWLEHQTQLRLGAHESGNMQAAYNHFGPAAFTFSVLEVLPRLGRAPEARWLAEQRWMDQHRALGFSLLNVRPAGSDTYLTKTQRGRQAAQQAGFKPGALRGERHKHKRNPDHF